jgi:hypothetical protein
LVTEAQEVDRSEERQASAFISYSREDKDFVRRLDAAFTKRNRETWVDLEDIRPTEEWLAGVYAGIEGADAFVFVISPDSVESRSCLLELAHAVEHNKRLVPIVRREVDTSAVPEPLRSPQWIFFREQDDFEEAFQELVDALDTDFDWVHAHTRLLTRAIEWNDNGRNNSFLLRGSDLRTAEGWQVRAADKEPRLTPLQTEYIVASRRAERMRQWLILGAVTFALIVTVALAVLFLLARNEAERQADIALGRQLTAQAQLAAEEEPRPLQRSVLLAVEARKQSPVPSFEADRILRDALTLLPRPIARLSHEGDLSHAVFSPDGKYLATASESSVRLWKVSNRDEVARWHNGGWTRRIAFTPDGAYLYVVNSDYTVRRWNVGSGEEVARMTIPMPLEGGEQPHLEDARFSPDGQYLYVASTGTVRVWDLSSGEEVALVEDVENATNITFSSDGKYLAASENEIVRVVEMSSRKEIALVEGVENSRSVAAVSPGGEYLATVESSGTGPTGKIIARVWETSSGDEVARMTQEAPAGSNVGITDIVLSRGGKYLATNGSLVPLGTNPSSMATSDHGAMPVTWSQGHAN